jgi:hypothetical protein
MIFIVTGVGHAFAMCTFRAVRYRAAEWFGI